MIKKIQKHFSKVDIFGSQVSLTFRDQEQYKTSFGGLISLLILGTLISFFYNNIISFFAMTQVTADVNEIFEDDPGLLRLPPEQFMFAVQIDQANFTGNPFYNVTVEQRYYQRFPNGTQVQYPATFVDLVPCTLDHFQPIFTAHGLNFSAQFKSNSLSNFLCPNLVDRNNATILIGGTFLSNDYYFVRILVRPCTDPSLGSLSWKPVCKTPAEVDAQMKSRGNFRIRIFTTNYLVNPTEPTNYVQPYLATDQYYTFIPIKMFMQSDIFFRGKKIVTDSGILMYEQLSEEFLGYREHMDNKDQVVLDQNNGISFAVFFFNRSPYSQIIKRRFMKLDELLSYLGGFAQFMLVIVGVFVVYYNKYHMIVSIANDLYQFKKEDRSYTIRVENSSLNHSTNKLQQSGIIRKKLNNMDQMGESRQLKAFRWKQKTDTTHKFDASELSQKNSSKKFKLQVLKATALEYFDKFKELVHEQGRIPFSMRLALSLMLPVEGLMGDDCVLIKKGIDQVCKELDLHYLLSKVQEINKLKQVIMSDEQITLFNFSQKPSISLIKENNFRSLSLQISKDQELQDKDIRDKYQQLVLSYQKLIMPEEEELSNEQIQFNLRLVQILGTKLASILNKELADCLDESYEPNPDADEDDK